MSGNTGSDGLQFIVNMTWPQVGGQYFGYFWSTSSGCPDYNDSTTADYVFCIASGSFYSPGHAVYTAGPGDTLIGGLPDHPDHPDNHIGIPAMLDSLASVSQEWAARFPAGPKIAVNDMSLYSGGVFDTNDDWVSPQHCGHRVGMEVDIRNWNLSATQQRIARRLFRNRKFIVELHARPAHWHLKYNGAGTYRGPGSTLP